MKYTLFNVELDIRLNIENVEGRMTIHAMASGFGSFEEIFNVITVGFHFSVHQ